MLYRLLNELHPALRFTREKENNMALAFLRVLIHSLDIHFSTSVYSKPTFMGLYTRWSSLCSRQQKLNLIMTPVHRAVKNCFQTELRSEIEFATKVLMDNGYRLDIVQSNIGPKTAQFKKPKLAVLEKCHVYLQLPWTGEVSTGLTKQISQC